MLLPILEADEAWDDNKHLTITVMYRKLLQSLYIQPSLPFIMQPQDILEQPDFLGLEVITSTQAVRIEPIRGIAVKLPVGSWRYRVSWISQSGQDISKVLSFQEICAAGGLLGNIIGVMSSSHFQRYQYRFSAYEVVITPDTREWQS